MLATNEIFDPNTSTSETVRTNESYQSIIDGLASHLKIFVVLGMFLFADLLKQLSKADREAVIEKMINETIIDRIITAISMIYKIKVNRIKNRVVFSKNRIKCVKCGSMMARLDGKVYPRLSAEFLRDLGITILASVFPKKIFIQRFGCINKHCQSTTGSLKRKDLPYSIYSFGVMDFILTTYLGSGASLRVVSELCKRIDRPVSPIFVWKQVQKVGNLFSRQVELLSHLFSGHYGVDECYPPTVEGKSGILAAIDQVHGFIVCIRQGTTFKKRDIGQFLKELDGMSPKFYSLMTDLSGIYNRVTFDLPRRVVHLCCQFHVKRNFKQFYESGVRKTAKMKDQTLKAERNRQLQAILLVTGDIFKSTSSVEALEKIALLLSKRHKYKSHPELPLLFKYLERYQDLLIQSYDSRSIPTTNNLIERFFGHVRHKLKNVRGWKQKETLLGYIQALALYRNYLALKNSSIAIKSIRTGDTTDVKSLRFSEYLFGFFSDPTVSSTNALPTHSSTDWNDIFNQI